MRSSFVSPTIQSAAIVSLPGLSTTKSRRTGASVPAAGNHRGGSKTFVAGPAASRKATASARM